jgi:tetratricopeptide (TPR) repeat protein
MLKLIRELRRREVFRTVGLYVGISWILIEASSVMLPAFEAPDWALRAVIILAVVGLPIVIVLAWVYDITDKGIEVQADASDTQVIPFGGRSTDFVVIGILAMALVISIYMNITGTGNVVEVELEPVTVLIADFKNDTGDAMFDGLLEQALTIGVEAAPNITAYKRTAAQESYKKLNPDGAEVLDNVAAQLVAVREGIQMVLIGSIASAGNGYDLVMTGHDSLSDEDSFRVAVSAKSRNDVLAAVGTLSEEVREALGDQSFKDKESATVENFTAASLEAARDYVTALDLSYSGDHEEAVVLFESATQKDPNFGRAYSGWALSAYKLGRKDEADELWKQALTLMNTMTERERLRTLGLYYAVVTNNLIKAKETFAELVTKYPSDAAARNNLQVVSFMTLDFQRASDEGKVLLELYPNSSLYRSNFALLATYSGEFAEADAAAQQLVTDDPDYAVSYLVIASAAMSRGDYDVARDAYIKMLTATKSEYDESMGTFGLADIELYLGNFAKARDLASQGIEENLAAGNKAGAAAKLILVAESYLGQGNNQEAAKTARRAFEAGTRTSQKVSAALVAIAAGEPALAREVSESLGKELQPQSRAYGLMIEGALLRQEGERIASIDKLQAAVERADLWLIRYQLGRAYFDAGFFAAAGDEFRLCGADRQGEATAVFLDDVPTYRYLAELPYWLGRSEESLGMTDAAKENYMKYVATRPNGGPRVDDARQRAGQ